MLQAGSKKFIRVIQLFLLVAIAVLMVRLHRIQSSGNYHGNTWKNYHTTVFNTSCILRLKGESAQCDEAARQIISRLFLMHKSLNRFDTTSAVSEFNAHPAHVPYPCDTVLWEAFQASRDAFTLTDGAFDITILPLLQFWKRHPDGVHAESDKEELARLKQQVGFDKLLFDENAHTVTKSAEGMCADFGGIAKGLALDAVRKTLLDKGLKSFIIDLGGNLCLSQDIPCVDICDPFNRSATLCTIKNAGGRFIATSSNGERPITPGKVGHIINPSTGESVINVLSVTAITDKGVYSDIFSTAVFVGGMPLAERLLGKLPECGFVIYNTPQGSPVMTCGKVELNQ